MADQYDSVSVVSYNANPPADDGTVTEANRVKWSTIKTKLTDMLNTAIASINTNVIAAFGKVDGGITSTAISYTVLAADQGKLVRATVAGVTITTPDAAGVGDPFVFGFLNDSTGTITLDGSGSQTIDGDTTVTDPAGNGGRLRTDGTNWFTEGQNFQRTQVIPQGYLSLVNTATSPLTGVPASDQSAKTAVYYRPDNGNLLPIPNGTLFAVREFSELTLTLVANHAANAIYDVFAFDDAGTIRVGTGPAWTTATAGSGARGTGAGTTELEKLKGLAVNKVAITLRNGSTTYSVAAKCGIYLGSIYMDGTNGQVSCHVSYGQSRKWGVWNAYNRMTIYLKAGDNTVTWSYATATTRAANGSSSNCLDIFCGLAEEFFDLEYAILSTASLASGTTTAPRVSIGYNSTAVASGRTGGYSNHADGGNGTLLQVAGTCIANYFMPPALGINRMTALESGLGASGGVTWLGTEANMVLSAKWRG